MLIANPIYDVVFKYLLEDIEIARELLSTILGEEIINLELKPQETATEHTSYSISIIRFDFKAIIKTKNGETKKVLIELQKAKQALDVMRFRRYLGENYKKEDEFLNDKGNTEKQPLPIVTIYFLGFYLENILNAIVKINRVYQDVITQEILDVKEDFVELLTHDTYVIQLRRLTTTTRTKLEQVLNVFSAEYKTDDEHQLDFVGDLEEPLVKKMVTRLGRAIASDEIRNIMDVEDELDRIIGKKDKQIAEIDLRLELAEKNVVLAEMNAALAKKEAEVEKQKADMATKNAQIAKQEVETEKLKTANLLKELEALKEQLKKK